MPYFNKRLASLINRESLPPTPLNPKKGDYTTSLK